MTSAAGVRYGVGMLRLSHFQQCAVRRLPSRKSSSTPQFHPNPRYAVPYSVDLWSIRAPRADRWYSDHRRALCNSATSLVAIYIVIPNLQIEYSEIY